METLNIDRINRKLEALEPEEILRWAWETFAPDVAASSSFHTQSVPLLHMISRICPAMPVIFVDTGFHFPETLVFRDELQQRLRLNLRIVRPMVEAGSLNRHYGEGLYRRDPDRCCQIHKVEPMERALAGLRAWVSGVRGDQTEHRKNLRLAEPGAGGILAIHPILHWTRADSQAYMQQHGLPAHPLLQNGYTSIGCAPCTRPVEQHEEERAGRWHGTEKKECGLHTHLKRKQGKRDEKKDT